MTFSAKLLALAAGLPALMAAADPETMKLIMPDAAVVAEINVAQIMASPIGSAMADAVRQGIAAQSQAALAKAGPEVRAQIAVLTRIDWSKEVQDVLFAGGNAKNGPALIIVRTSLDAAKIRSLQPFTSDMQSYDGVPILVSSKAGNAVFAFLDNGIVVMGQLGDVKSAISRRNHTTPLSPALAAQVAEYSAYDVWWAATGTFDVPPLSGPAAQSPAAVEAVRYLAKIANVNGGLRFSPDFGLSADVEARTEKAAAELSDGLRWLTNAVQSQAKSAGKAESGLEGFKYHVRGKHILLSLRVPEQQIVAGLRQMRQMQPALATRPLQPVQAAAASQPALPPPSSGLPPPPAGTIRVQSSDMGTVLIPTGKQN